MSVPALSAEPRTAPDAPRSADERAAAVAASHVGADVVWNRVRKLDLEELHRQFQSAKPYRHVWIENLLEPGFAAEVCAAYPSYSEARDKGKQFRAVNENLKVQVTDRARFPEAVRELDRVLAAPAFLEAVEAITGIRNLEADPLLVGGGMHMMARGGRLDVHVDFNMLPDRGLHRRLNILVYLNPEWHEEWGGSPTCGTRRCASRPVP